MPRHFLSQSHTAPVASTSPLFPLNFSRLTPHSSSLPSSAPSHAQSVLSSAALTTSNLLSPTPLFPRLQSLHSSLSLLLQRTDWSTSTTSCESALHPHLLSLLSLLRPLTSQSSSTTVSPPSIPSLAPRFPDLDLLLSSLLSRVDSPTLSSLLLDCCAAWIAVNEGGTQRPRWFTSPLSSPSLSDSALLCSLTSSLSPSSPWALRVSTVAFLSALSREHQGRDTNVHTWLTSPSLLPILLTLCSTRSLHWSTRVHALCESSQLRLMTSLFSDTPRIPCDPPPAVEADAEQEDSQCYSLLIHTWTLLQSLASSHRHEGEQQTQAQTKQCPLCDDSMFVKLMDSERGLWSSHRTALTLLIHPTHGPTSPCFSIVSLLCTAWGALLSFIKCTMPIPSNITSPVTTTATEPTAPWASTSTVSLWLHLTAEVVRAGSTWWENEAFESRTRQMAVSLLPPIVLILKRGFCRWDPSPPSSISPTSPAEDQCASLFEAVHAVLAAARSIAVHSSPAPTWVSVDVLEECVKGGLQVHTAFISHYRKSDLLGAAVGLSCDAFIPLAAAVLGNASATLDVLHLVFASLLLLLQASQVDPVCRGGVLYLLIQTGLIESSWKSADALLLASQSQPKATEDRRALAAFDASVRWNAAVMAAIAWTEEKSPHSEKTWQTALTMPFTGEDVHCWQRTLQALQQPQPSGISVGLLPLLISLCIVSLIGRFIRTRGVNGTVGIGLNPPSVMQVHFHEREVLKVVQQVVTGSSASALSRPTLIHLSLLVVILEDGYHLSLSTKGSKAKGTFLSLLHRAGVSWGDLTLSPSMTTHLHRETLTRWLWKQSPTLKEVSDLHDHLLSTALTSASLPGNPQQSQQGRAEWVAGEANALKALVRRWGVEVESLSRSTVRSIAVDGLLRFTHQLLPLIPPQRALVAGLLQPISNLVGVGYHRIFAHLIGEGGEVGLTTCLVSPLLSLVSEAASIVFSVDRTVRVSAFQCAVDLLLSHGQAGPAVGSDIPHRVQVQLLCLQLITAVLRYERKVGGGVDEYAKQLQTGEVRNALSSLLRCGQSLSKEWNDKGGEIIHEGGARRVALTNGMLDGNPRGTEEVGLLRLQLQLAGMELSTSLQRGWGDLSSQTPPSLLTIEETLPLLQHSCVEVRMVTLRYVAAALISQGGRDGDGRDGDLRLAVLLSIQCSLLPHCSHAVSSAALCALSSLLASSPPPLRTQLLSHPWHSFVIQSSLFALSQMEATLPSRRVVTSVLLRYLHLLMGQMEKKGGAEEESKPNEEDYDDDGMECVARLYLMHWDSRLLAPLLSFSPGGGGAGGEGRVCISTLHHWVTVLLHMRHAGCLPLSAASALTPRLQSLVATMGERRGGLSTCPLFCPASSEMRGTSADAGNAQRSQTQVRYSQLSLSQSQSQSQVDSSASRVTESPKGEVVGAEEAEEGQEELCQCEERRDEGASASGAVMDVRRLLRCVGEKAELLLRLLQR